jgi:hypothetical protein
MIGAGAILASIASLNADASAWGARRRCALEAGPRQRPEERDSPSTGEPSRCANGVQ